MMPDTAVAHFLITRFAVRLTQESTVPTDEWIMHRCELFERYCLPSVRSQTRTDFTWLILVDPLISERARARIEGYSAAFEALRVCNVPSDAADAYSLLIGSLVPPTATTLITTRIDSDDAISVDHVERIRAAAETVDLTRRTAIVFTSGFELSAGRLYWRPFPASPFASLVEHATDRPTTVMATGHEELSQVADVRELNDPPGWLQVVHGGNVLNRVRGVRVPRSRLAGTFITSDPELVRRESLLSLTVGIPASWFRLAFDLLRNPRYLRKVTALFNRHG